MDALDGMFLAFSAVAAGWFAYLLLVDGARPGGQSLLLVVFWVFVAYLLLPRLHRIFTHIYLPDYFIGQARTSDGRIGDPVNLAWRGREAQLHEVMSTAEWVRADDLDFRAGRRIVTSTLRRRSYPGAPVSPLVLFDRQQDFAYEREVAGSPSRRHHVRFWRCPEGWMLPGGFAVDWLAAATYDRRVGLSTFTLQVTHKIDAHVDVERDFVVTSVTRAVPAVDVSVIDHFSSGYHSRNGGGDVVETDGDLPVVDVRRVEVVDPELPMLTLDDLGVIRGVEVDGGEGKKAKGKSAPKKVKGGRSGNPAKRALEERLVDKVGFTGSADNGIALIPILYGAPPCAGNNTVRLIATSISPTTSASMPGRK